MKKNIGKTDIVIRILIAVLIAVLYLTDAVSGTTAIILAVVAVVALFTGIIGWCGLYALLGISTCRKKGE